MSSNTASCQDRKGDLTCQKCSQINQLVLLKNIPIPLLCATPVKTKNKSVAIYLNKKMKNSLDAHSWLYI